MSFFFGLVTRFIPNYKGTGCVEILVVLAGNPRLSGEAHRRFLPKNSDHLQMKPMKKRRPGMATFLFFVGFLAGKAVRLGGWCLTL